MKIKMRLICGGIFAEVLFMTCTITPVRADNSRTDILSRLSGGEDVNILIAGDSIGISSHATDTKYSWTAIMEEYLENTYGSDVYVNNISMNGNISYSEYVRVNALNDKIQYDLVILCVGENDDAEEFSYGYEALIRSVEKKYPGCRIISMLQSSQNYDSEKIKKTLELDSYYGITVADTIAAFAASGMEYSELSDDGIHPNDTGYGIYAETICHLIDNCISNGELPSPALNEQVTETGLKQLDEYAYYSAESFSYDGEKTYDMDTGAIHGMLGMDFGVMVKGCTVDVYTDGEFRVRYTADKKVARYITPVTEDISANSHIQIVFSDASQAAAFQGIIISGTGNGRTDESVYLPVTEVTGTENTSLGVKVTWNKTENADSYYIYRKRAGGKTYKNLGKVYSGDATEYIDMTAKSGKSYTYSVSAVRDDIHGAYEPGIKTTFLGTPEADIKNGSGFIKISWDKISGAGGYIVYRKEYGGKWKKQKVLKKKTSMVFRDKNVKNNTMYIYSVRAYTDNAQSAMGEEKGITYVENPEIELIQNADNGVEIQWKETDGADGYIVYRKTGKYKYKRIRKLKGGDSTYFRDENVMSGRTYTYAVKAQIDGCTGSYEEEDIKYLSAPDVSKNVKTKSHNRSVVLKWKRVRGAAGYYVYRKGKNGEWKMLKKITSGNKLKYTDNNVISGAGYSYRVYAYKNSSLSAYGLAK